MVGSATLRLYQVKNDESGASWVGGLQGVTLGIDSDSSFWGAVPQLIGGLETPLSILFNQRGQIEGVGFQQRPPSATESMLRTLVASLQFAAPEKAGATRWETEEPDSNGRCVVEYANVGPDRYTKKKLRCPFILANQEGGLSQPPIIRAQATVERKHGMPIGALQSEEVLVVPLGTGDMTCTARLTLTQAAPSGDRHEFTGYQAWRVVPLYGDLVQSKENPDSVKKWKEELIAGYTYEMLTQQIRSAVEAGDDTARMKSFERLKALHDLHPESVAAASAALRAPMDTAASEAIVAALGGSESPQAQDALNALARDESYPSEVRSHALAHMGLHDRPDAETIETLSQMAAEEPSELQTQAALALGGAARRGGNDEPSKAASNAATEQLSRGLASATSGNAKALYLAALGNAGARQSLAALEARLSDPDPRIRQTATFSLRFIEGDDVDRLLGSVLVGDEAVEVRGAAIQAMEYRPLSHILAQACLTTMQREPEAMIRMGVVRWLVRELPNAPSSALQALELAKKDADEEIRGMALTAGGGA